MRERDWLGHIVPRAHLEDWACGTPTCLSPQHITELHQEPATMELRWGQVEEEVGIRAALDDEDDMQEYLTQRWNQRMERQAALTQQPAPGDPGFIDRIEARHAPGVGVPSYHAPQVPALLRSTTLAMQAFDGDED